jgi:hypothetical protein
MAVHVSTQAGGSPGSGGLHSRHILKSALGSHWDGRTQQAPLP